MRFSSRKAATKVGKDCRSVRATGEGSHEMAAVSTYLLLRNAMQAGSFPGGAGNKVGNNAGKSNAGTGGKATLENEW